MSERNDHEGEDAEVREELLRRARWHLAEALRHRHAAEGLVADVAALREEGSGDELVIMEEIAGLMAELEAEAEVNPEMGEDPEGDAGGSYDPIYHDFGAGAQAWLEAEERERVPPRERGGRTNATRTTAKWEAELGEDYRKLRTEGHGPAKSRDILFKEREDVPEKKVSMSTLKRYCKG